MLYKNCKMIVKKLLKWTGIGCGVISALMIISIVVIWFLYDFPMTTFYRRHLYDAPWKVERVSDIKLPPFKSVEYIKVSSPGFTGDYLDILAIEFESDLTEETFESFVKKAEELETGTHLDPMDVQEAVYINGDKYDYINFHVGRRDFFFELRVERGSRKGTISFGNR